MKTFKSTDQFKIAGRGNIMVVHIPNPQRLRYHQDVPVVGEMVSIDDNVYEVLGVETFMKLMSPPCLGENVGLLVRPV